MKSKIILAKYVHKFTKKIVTVVDIIESDQYDVIVYRKADQKKTYSKPDYVFTQTYELA